MIKEHDTQLQQRRGIYDIFLSLPDTLLYILEAAIDKLDLVILLGSS